MSVGHLHYVLLCCVCPSRRTRARSRLRLKNRRQTYRESTVEACTPSSLTALRAAPAQVRQLRCTTAAIRARRSGAVPQEAPAAVHAVRAGPHSAAPRPAPTPRPAQGSTWSRRSAPGHGEVRGRGRSSTARSRPSVAPGTGWSRVLTAAISAPRWGAVLRLPPPHTHNGPVPARALEPSLGEEGAGTRPRAPPAPHRALCDPERHEAGSARRLAAPTGGRRPPTKGPFTHPERFRARGGAGGGGGRPRGDEWDLGAGRAGSLGKSRAGPQHVAVAPTADSARAGGALRAPICPPTHHPSIIHPSASAAVTPTAWSRPLPSAPPQRPVLNVTLPPERRVRR